ncbi:TPA: hypothetical protein ACHWKL_003180 [Providencia stuartii]|uniref:Uncharacterized protein n=2 Tax=Providencia stuartii TaxID=588 RepID=A0AAJ1JEE0_PROST|nr:MULTISPECIES: hypothetical protein [Providencia]AFH94437.1 hypothetical protein S70_12970 [Providencia stuartii MRSN 2154]AIN63730.1 putative membrane protein [Providencia stuartii]APG52340.1 hypothetical protein BGK56_15900 [Providencia stuartii]AVL41420.1 hypothetical protein CEP70_16225 [Providencia stuartii]AXO19734.1 hypothetical protein MC79_014700 [Providencia stuartii]
MNNFRFLLIFLPLFILVIFVASLVSSVIIDIILFIINGKEFDFNIDELWSLIKLSIIGGSVSAVGLWILKKLKHN